MNTARRHNVVIWAGIPTGMLAAGGGLALLLSGISHDFRNAETQSEISRPIDPSKLVSALGALGSASSTPNVIVIPSTALTSPSPSESASASPSASASASPSSEKTPNTSTTSPAPTHKAKPTTAPSTHPAAANCTLTGDTAHCGTPVELYSGPLVDGVKPLGKTATEFTVINGECMGGEYGVSASGVSGVVWVKESQTGILAIPGC